MNFIDLILTNINKPWDWTYLSENPNITWEIIQDNPSLPWDWKYVSGNPNITWEIIRDNPDKDWDWSCISQNPNITPKIIHNNIISNDPKPWCWSDYHIIIFYSLIILHKNTKNLS